MPVQPQEQDIRWDRDSRILVVAADRSLASVLARLEEENPEWVVVVRTPQGSPEVYYYAFLGAELRYLAREFPERRTWPLEEAMDMHEWMSSAVSRRERLSGPGLGTAGPAAGRVVDFDASGAISAIGEHQEMIVHTLEKGPDEGELRSFDLGEFRGGSARKVDPNEPFGAGTEIEVTLSAETRAEIAVGSLEKVNFRLELTSEAAPLAVSQPAHAHTDVPIVVSLAVENETVVIDGETEFTLEPPASQKPRNGFFLVRGNKAGESRLAVRFRQGGSELGVIGLAMAVVDGAVRAVPAQGTTVAAAREVADDDKLALVVEQRRENGEIFYQFILHSEALGLEYRRLRSKPLLDRGGGPAATTQAFVEHIYERVTQKLKSLDDFRELQREVRALGASLCQELFDPEVAKVLWPLRDKLKLVQVVSWEPYIPWELVRLRDPDSGEIDERFLAEYGLVRTLSDDMPPRTFPLAKWVYLGATFRYLQWSSVGAELDYFTGAGADSLQGHGIASLALAGTRDAFYDTLAAGDFDVLHIACHAESPQQAIDRAKLIIGDEMPPDGSPARPVEVDTLTVEAEARLKARRPLVFLNGCETGREGAVLTAWGGWPNVFLRQGAGAFVGSSWPVRDKPAAVFSTAFYNALLDGKILAEAADAARAAAKKLGDASWLAFKVYGHPRARRAG